MTLVYEFQKLNQPPYIDLYDIDLSPIGTSIIYRFVPDKNTDQTSVSFKGQTYNALPILVTGFELTSKAPFPKPEMIVSNITGQMSALMTEYKDLVGAKLTRRRTLVRYLDGQAEAHNADEAIPEIYFIEQPIEENELHCVFKLVNGMDMEGVILPGRYITRRCGWQYRDANCGYTGSRMFDKNDNETYDMRLDECSHTVNGCQLRFGRTGELRYGGYPLIDP
jgi:lambda family phage minor tail protein L